VKQAMLSALLSLDIECNATLPLNKLDQSTSWKQDVCTAYFLEYADVKLRAIRNTLKKMDGRTSNKKIEISRPIAGRMTIKRNIEDENHVWMLVTTFYAIDAFKEVWITQKAIKKNEVLIDRDIKKEVRNIGSLIGLKTFPHQNPTGFFIEKGLARNQIIYTDYLSVKPLIKKDKEVTVIFASGSLKLKIKGVALENGFKIEDSIKVRLIDTSKIFTGKIKDDETVDVDI
jgi:flagella basal body P-ring formation protein FlgA